MPCRSDYLDPTPLEIQVSKLYCLRDEIDTGVHVDPDSCEWQGNGKGYGENSEILREKVDNLTVQLCQYCTGRDISHHSLELQIWWRDHQKLDNEQKDTLDVD